jgi:excisionase family DNA binding protein
MKEHDGPPDLDDIRAAVREELRAARRQEAAPDPLLTEADVAEVLGLTPRTLRTMRKAGEIQALRVRGCVRYTRAAVESYIDRQVAAGEAQR